MSNEIPTKSRELVKARSNGRCERCGGAGTDWHHRRRRAVKDEHTHHPCNGVLLCRTCHSWAHAHPRLAREEGWILAMNRTPMREPINTAWGLRQPDCEGGWVP
jgi:5-methylcytosine-specific restriction protein A